MRNKVIGVVKKLYVLTLSVYFTWKWHYGKYHSAAHNLKLKFMRNETHH